MYICICIHNCILLPMFQWDLLSRVSSKLTMESTRKLHVMISAVSTMLLKGLHGATSKASCREQDTNIQPVLWQTPSAKRCSLRRNRRRVALTRVTACRTNSPWSFRALRKQQGHFKRREKKKSSIDSDMSKTASGLKYFPFFTLFCVARVKCHGNQRTTK